MKKAKIVLILSLLIFITLLIIYITSLPKNEEEKPVSLREQYQQELEAEKGGR